MFASAAQTLVNTVATVGVMGKGVALEFERFPDMFEDYQRRCEAGLVRIGEPYVFTAASAAQCPQLSDQGPVAWGLEAPRHRCRPRIPRAPLRRLGHHLAGGAPLRLRERRARVADWSARRYTPTSAGWTSPSSFTHRSGRLMLGRPRAAAEAALWTTHSCRVTLRCRSPRARVGRAGHRIGRARGESPSLAGGQDDISEARLLRNGRRHPDWVDVRAQHIRSVQRGLSVISKLVNNDLLRQSSARQDG